jgi:hypothetical protein
VAFVDDEETRWLGVIGRSLAFISLHVAEMRDKQIAEQAEFLGGLGLTRQEIAPIVGSTAESVGELLRQRRNKTKGGKGATKKRAKKSGSRK